MVPQEVCTHSQRRFTRLSGPKSHYLVRVGPGCQHFLIATEDDASRRNWSETNAAKTEPAMAQRPAPTSSLAVRNLCCRKLLNGMPTSTLTPSKAFPTRRSSPMPKTSIMELNISVVCPRDGGTHRACVESLMRPLVGSVTKGYGLFQEGGPYFFCYRVWFLALVSQSAPNAVLLRVAFSSSCDSYQLSTIPLLGRRSRLPSCDAERFCTLWPDLYR